MDEEKELNADVNMTVYTGGEEWEKVKKEVSQAFVESIDLPLTDEEKLEALPYPLFFRPCVKELIGRTFYHEYEDIFKGRKMLPSDFDYSLENLLNGFKDLHQIKSLALAFKACIKRDNEFAMIFFKDFSLLGFSTIN